MYSEHCQTSKMAQQTLNWDTGKQGLRILEDPYKTQDLWGPRILEDPGARGPRTLENLFCLERKYITKQTEDRIE